MSKRVGLSLLVGLAVVVGTIVLVSANREPHHLRGPHPMRSGPIVVVKTEPYPEGPPAPPFLLSAGPNQLPIRKILRFIPRPLPEPLDQGFNCGFGGNLTIAFEGCARVVYGPCHRPASINRLWARMVFVITDGGCAPGCGPGRPP
jgi:hypothetical protein